MEEIAESGRKAIVFSQWVGTIERLAGELDRFGPLEYHGKIPSGRRDAVIQRFREDRSKHVLLMSYGAGGVGLNLQFVNYVFLFDRWWNPAVEDQAINRAHRIGVDGPVNVTRFLTLETIEERIDRVLQEKRELFEMIFSGAEGRRKLGLTQEELFGLFRLKMSHRPDRPGGVKRDRRSVKPRPVVAVRFDRALQRQPPLGRIYATTPRPLVAALRENYNVRMANTLGYHYVKSCYGLWLPGDDRGSWSDWCSYMFDQSHWENAVKYIKRHNLRRGRPARPYSFLM